MTEAAVPLLFWLLSLLARRRAVRVAAGTGRRNDARRRLRIRRYFQRRQRKMTLVLPCQLIFSSAFCVAPDSSSCSRLCLHCKLGTVGTDRQQHLPSQADPRCQNE
ncbi:uncharacterized protein LOC132405968 isoform X3 [Hypanus sabinus]|uniref:uncharacterized protein LOC132405968 isoform X3 n=1 Tax=Hypanus sabinus TaxID=79690 RepID=UPI0028C445B6|nr:uncharacterized protein LOC132405968 isoform X3 [Hypanus sabinus]